MADHKVLILVLVEDGFRVDIIYLSQLYLPVLILVLVEDGFRGIMKRNFKKMSDES